MRPHDARVLYDLGFAEERNGEQDEAAKAYAAAIEAGPELGEPRVALGLLEARGGDADKAHAQLQSAAALTSASPELRGRALRALAMLDETKQPGQARDELLQAVQLTGETPADVTMGADLANRAGETPDAESAYRRALSLRPGDVDASTGLAQTLQKQGKLLEAETVLKDALAQSAGDARLVSQLASVYVAEDKASEAIPLLEQLRSTPDYANSPAVARMLARVYAMNGQNPEAEKLYASLSAQSAKDPALLDDYGSVLVREQRYADAEEVLARAAAMRMDFHDDAAWGAAEAHLAFAASKNHQPQIALQALSERATVLPDTPAVLFLKAISYDALHQNRQAVQAYKAFLAVAQGKFPDEEFQARHRLVALEHEK